LIFFHEELKPAVSYLETAGFMDFSNYSARDFVLNDSFQKWILEPDEETNAYWEEWIISNPNKSEAVEEARALIQSIKSTIEKNIKCDRDEVWERITKDINKKQPTSKSL
jgi:transmembrane sensor